MDEDVVSSHAVALRKHRMQVTAQRLAVLRAIDRKPHGTADELERLVRDEIGAISRQSIYDTLTTLTDKGLLRRIQPAGSATRYEQRVDDNHHHIVCRACSRTVDVDCVKGLKPCLDVIDDQGFAIDEAEVIFWGICPSCQVKASTDEEAQAQEIETHKHKGVR